MFINNPYGIPYQFLAAVQNAIDAMRWTYRIKVRTVRTNNRNALLFRFIIPEIADMPTFHWELREFEKMDKYNLTARAGSVNPVEGINAEFYVRKALGKFSSTLTTRLCQYQPVKLPAELDLRQVNIVQDPVTHDCDLSIFMQLNHKLVTSYEANGRKLPHYIPTNKSPNTLSIPIINYLMHNPVFAKVGLDKQVS